MTRSNASTLMAQPRPKKEAVKLPSKITSVIIIALSLITLGAQVAAAAGPKILVAHRGFGGAAQIKYNVPENSVAAWDKAIDLAEAMIYVDMDGRNAKNGMIVMHDSTLNRTTNVSDKKKYYVKDQTLSFIKSRFLELPIDRDGNGNDDNTPYHPPSVNQAFAHLAGKKINGQSVKITFEAKGGGWTQTQVNKLASTATKNGISLSKILFHSFDKTVVGYGKNAGFTNRAYVIDGTPPSAAEILKYASTAFVRIDNITAAKVDEYHSYGIDVAVWTLNTEAEYNDALNIEADIWICDDVKEAQDKLAEVGAPS